MAFQSSQQSILVSTLKYRRQSSPLLQKNSGLSVISLAYSGLYGRIASANQLSVTKPDLYQSTSLKKSYVSMWVNSRNSRFIRKPSTKSCEVIAPVALVSKIRKASKRLKSYFKARSILADSVSLWIKMISLKALARSVYCSRESFGSWKLACLNNSLQFQHGLQADFLATSACTSPLIAGCVWSNGSCLLFVSCSAFR